MHKHHGFCPNCGAPVFKSGKFCSRCGYPVPSFKAQKWPLFVIGVSLLAVLVIIISPILIKAEKGPVTGELVLGTSAELISQTVPAGGGEILVGDTSSALPGLQINVPAGAYGQDTGFTIATSPVVSHTFGALFNPVTPLIRIDNGHAFADAAMTVTIPVSIGDGEFAMAFYYDRDTGTLEGIPCLAQDSASLTILTAHFSELIVTKAKFAELDLKIKKNAVDSGFLPGRDDFAAANYGSFAQPKGHCAGQSIAAMTYYDDFRATYGSLRKAEMVDNNAYKATPMFYQDDALAYRLCSKMQSLYASKWPSAWDATRDANEELTYYCFVYAILMTGQPQYISIKNMNLSGGHAMVVYKVTKDALWISDPNTPGDFTRKIDVSRTLDAAEEREKVLLGSYYAMPNANGVSTEYPWIAYYGVSALIDEDKAASLLQQMLSGQDAAADVFQPFALEFEAFPDAAEDDFILPSSLTAGKPLTITQQPDAAKQGTAMTLLIAPTLLYQGQRLEFYNGTDFLGSTEEACAASGKWFPYELKPGVNDIGIFFTIKDADGFYNYVDFYRFTVIISTKETPTSEVAPAAEYFGQWELTELSITGYTGMTEAYREDITFSGGDPDRHVRQYLALSHDVFSSTESLDRFLARIGIGEPPDGSGESWAGKYFFQTNTECYIGDHDVLIDGVKQNYRNVTLAATMGADGTMHVVGYDGEGGLSPDDKYTDLVLTKTGNKTISGTGTTVLNFYDGGMVTVSVEFTMKRISKNPDLESEYKVSG
jgi:hypothetical protein